ncbi:MAG: hypothetical protein JNK82_16340 [Myxococcaceae bacterium]|nr:hypothetical protein [Myxococcaceae bacterium]
MSARARLCLIALLCASCLEDNQLGGSMSEVFPLDVSRVEIHRNPEAIRITFLRNRNIYLDIVASLTVSLYVPDGGGQVIDLGPGTKIDLSGQYALGHPRAAVVHAPGGEPSRLLPPVNKGDLAIHQGGLPDQETVGDFSVSFQETGGDIGFGRTLNGRFRATAIDAGFGELP